MSVALDANLAKLGFQAVISVLQMVPQLRQVEADMGLGATNHKQRQLCLLRALGLEAV